MLSFCDIVPRASLSNRNLNKAHCEFLSSQINQRIPQSWNARSLTGKVHPKSWSEIKEQTKTRRTPLTVVNTSSSSRNVLKFQILPHGRRHDSHFLN